jgi:mannosyltransferase
LRVWSLNSQGIWRDEADSLRFAASPSLLRQMFLTPGHNAPLYYLMLRGWAALAGSSIVSARAFSTVWGVLSLPLVYAVGRRLFASPRIGLLAALLAATSPYLVWYSQDARTYAPLVTMTLLALWLLLEALKSDRLRWWVAYVLAAGAGLYLHVTAALMLPVHFVVGMLIGSRGGSVGARRLIILVPLLALAMPLFWWEIRLLLSPFQTGHLPAGGGQAGAGLLLALTTGPAGRLGVWAALPGLFVCLIGAFAPLLAREPAGRASWRPIGITLIWLLLPPFGLWLISLAMPIYSERYLIFVVPAFCLLAAAGIQCLWENWRAAGVSMLIVLLAVNGAALWIQGTQTIKPDVRGAAWYFVARRQPADLVLFAIPQVEGAFAQVAPAGDARYAGAPFANRALSLEDIHQPMTALVGDSRRVWLVESESELWDGQGLIRQWLTEHSRQYERVEFHLVTLTLYTR